ncbi:MAG: hypothetical protein LKJ54_01625 [Acetobacter peroxydans]|jgi:hypothetical protein|nr:hypothetical protein [Acetobacter peroxydans]MCI2078137.1 hypothetical protein [Acetobacter peroxydans]
MSNNAQKQIDLYASLMAEINNRVDNINLAVSGKLGFSDPMRAQEFCYLQIRMVIENIALAALVAHGDMQGVSGLHKEWSADKIMNRLERLHENFYPKSCIQVGGDKSKIEYKQGIEKSELLKIYNNCGEKLHLGKLINIKNPKELNFGVVVGYVQEIYDFLNMHSIFLSDNKTVILCIMRTIETGKVNVARVIKY